MKNKYLFYTFLIIATVGIIYILGSIIPLGNAIRDTTTNCIDNDLADISIKGTLQLERGGNIVNSYEDSCNGDELTQYYCKAESYPKIFGAVNNLKGSETTTCRNGCNDGKCNPASTPPVAIPNEPTPEEPTPTQGLAPGDYTFDITISNYNTRSYKAHIPPSYDGTARPVVLMFHGGGGDAESIIKQSQMNTVSDQNNFIVVYPEGTGIAGIQTWNAGDCCGTAKEKNIDDVSFVNMILDDIEAKTPINTNKIYAAGHSNGGQMSYRLACELSNRITAVASNAGFDAYDKCNPQRKVPTMHVHGTADPIALYNGGTCGPTEDSKWTCGPVEDYVAEWADTNGCSAEPVIQTIKNSQKITYQNCQVDTIFFKIGDGGHTWPGGEYAISARWWKNQVGALSTDIDASKEMWNFFNQQSM